MDSPDIKMNLKIENFKVYFLWIKHLQNNKEINGGHALPLKIDDWIPI